MSPLRTLSFIGLLVCGSIAAAQDPWIGREVFLKNDAVIKVGNRIIEPEKIGFPARVGDVKGDWLWLGRAWVRKQDVMTDVNVALDDCTALINQTGGAIAYGRRGAVWAAKGEFQNAIADYTIAIKLASDNSLLYCNRGGVKLSIGDFDGAIVDSTEAIRLNPKSAHAYHVRGFAWANKKQYEKAMKDYRESVRIDPGFSMSWYNIACIHALAGRADEAIANLEIALKGGFRDFVVIDKDTDLDSIRDDPRFQALRKRYAK